MLPDEKQFQSLKQKLKRTPDGSLPIEWQNALDPPDVLGYLAANTSNIKLGTSVIDMFYYTPTMLAKRLATLDILSQGRMICGLGLGWSKDEYQASNIPFMNRGERADEFIQVLKKIWTDDIVEFKGKYYACLPKSVPSHFKNLIFQFILEALVLTHFQE